MWAQFVTPLLLALANLQPTAKSVVKWLLDANYQSEFLLSVQQSLEFLKWARCRDIHHSGFVTIWNNWLNIFEDMCKKRQKCQLLQICDIQIIVSIKITELH